MCVFQSRQLASTIKTIKFTKWGTDPHGSNPVVEECDVARLINRLPKLSTLVPEGLNIDVLKRQLPLDRLGNTVGTSGTNVARLELMGLRPSSSEFRDLLGAF